MSDDLQQLLASLSPEERDALIKHAQDECWREGDLRHLLHVGSQEIYDLIHARNETQEVFEISRKYGKTWLCVTLAAEACLRTPNARVVYGAPTLKHLREFVLPIMRKFEAMAPDDDHRPHFNAAESHWKFPNGSWVHLFGADDMTAAEKGRGPEAVRAIFDEAGFPPSEVLRYVISDVFKPSLLRTRTRPPPGAAPPWVILSSTPSAQPDHEFTRICEIAESRGLLFHRTIHDNPDLTPEEIRQVIEEDAAELGFSAAEYQRTSTFRREYLAERVVEPGLMVMGDDWVRARNGWADPEDANRVIPATFVEHPRPQFFDAYECLDFGGVDPRAALFGFWDFGASTLVIEDEVNLRNGENTLQLAEAIKAKESELYGVTQWEGTLRAIREEKMDERLEAFLPPAEVQRIRKLEAAPLQPYLRICDHDVQSAIDLWTLHRLAVIPAEKGEVRSRADEFRIALRMGRIRIHPRCRDLDRQLRVSEWTSPRATDFKRKNGEHADLLWCAITMWHNVRKTRNPVPPMFGITDPVEAMIRKRQLEHRSGLRAVARMGTRKLGT